MDIEVVARKIGCIALIMIASVGCAKEEQIISGTSVAIGSASMDGKPLSGAKLTLISLDNGRRVSGMVRPDGTFRVGGAPIGRCRVLLDNSRVKGRVAEFIPTPPKYRSFEESGLEVNLEPGENEGIVFNLEGN